ncbi:MAG: chromosome partitioning protein ParB [Acidobacteria bacterium SCN 69-37]|nr:MAG: chromosome partitioning protein ParB [Acidobacteria bacterium SCN 69-37]
MTITSTETTGGVRLIPIAAIAVMNPRARNRRVFNELVTSIRQLGLKRPITVCQRQGRHGYDLVCGQGRLEAFVALGETEISAVVVEASEEDCFVMSLVENLARRQHSPLDLMRQIGDLRGRGYSITEIAIKTAFSDEYISAICYLLDHGENRLLAAVDRGVVPATIAMEIAKAPEADVQLALTEAYEQRSLPGNQVLAIRGIIEQRRANGKGLGQNGRERPSARKRVSADSLVRAYRKETERQKLLVRRANLSQRRLLFVVNTMRRLLDDEDFVTLLQAEGLNNLPRPLAERVRVAR